jgi:NAD(P)-dependent dehydrogenase (short-subunit alcohol dehydrogenase family)
MRFAGKRAVVIGGNAGIGLAATRMFVAEGAQVAITGRNPETLAQVAGVIAVQADMGDIDATRAALDEIAAKLGGIDIFCLNAGVGGFAPIPEVTPQFWDEIHNVNLRGAFFAAQAALPHMSDGGSMVLTGSIGAVCAVPGNAAYAAAKAGLRAVARTLAVELLPRRIRVNMVSPGPTDTEIFKRDTTPEAIEGMRAMMRGVVPMQRMGTSEEVARAILFLASDDASFINGIDMFVDGGCVEL